MPTGHAGKFSAKVGQMEQIEKPGRCLDLGGFESCGVLRLVFVTAALHFQTGA